MIQPVERKAFKIFLKENDSLEKFEKKLLEDRQVTLDDYLFDDYLDIMSIMSSAFDYWSDTHNKGKHWMELNMKWRAYIVYVQKHGLPFMNEEVI